MNFQDAPVRGARALLIAMSVLALGACASLAPDPPAVDRPAASSGTSPATVPAAPAAVPTTVPGAAAPGTAPGTAPVATASVRDTTPATADDEVEPTRTVDPIQPERRVTEDRSSRLDLWQRIRDGYGMPDLENTLVASHEQAYRANPEAIKRMTERGSRYLFHIVEEVQRRQLPSELALLPFIESAFNPQALSRASASGIWQFMPQTGRHFDLKQNVFRDDRRDVLASTDAALDYLGKLYAMFGDWHLALAAYNWGEGNVSRAIKRNRAAGLATDYASLRLPNETRNYVPKFQAVKNMVSRPEAFGIALPVLENHPYFLAVAISRDIDVDLAARLARLPLDDFRSLNPQLNKPVIFASGTPQILLPYDNANTFVKALAGHKGPTASWTAWTLPTAMKSADAADRVGMSDEGFRTINHIPPRMILKGGSTVLVPRGNGKQAEVPEHLADNASMSLAPEVPPQRKIVWVVGKRSESVAAVAQRHRLSASQVAQWNSVSVKASFPPASRVTLFVPVGKVQVAARKPSSKARSTVAKSSRRTSSTAHLAQSRSSPRR